MYQCPRCYDCHFFESEAATCCVDLGDTPCRGCGYVGHCNCTDKRTVAEILGPPPEPAHDPATCPVCKTIDRAAIEAGMPVLKAESIIEETREKIREKIDAGPGPVEELRRRAEAAGYIVYAGDEHTRFENPDTCKSEGASDNWIRLRGVDRCMQHLREYVGCPNPPDPVEALRKRAEDDLAYADRKDHWHR